MGTMLERKRDPLPADAARPARRRRERWMRRAAESRPVRAVAAAGWTLALSAMGLLLGRATVLGDLSPFAAAFFAAVFFMRRDSLFWAGMAAAAGGFLAAEPRGFDLAAQLLIVVGLLRGLELMGRAEPSRAPAAVFFAVFAVKLFTSSMDAGLTWFGLVMTTVEASLSFVLAHIFLLAFPALAAAGRRAVRLKSEEVVCLMILLASLLTGTVGWTPGGVSVQGALGRWLIAAFACSGGAPVGAAAGAVTELVLSLADVGALRDIGVLAFAGLLAGLFREGRRIGVIAGLAIGSLLIVMVAGEKADVAAALLETGLAALLFAATPASFIAFMARFVPGTQEYARSQHEYARRVRDMTAGRVEQFSEVFRQLSASFQPPEREDNPDGRRERTARMIHEAAAKTCAGCFRRRQCWDEKTFRTLTCLTEMMNAVEEHPDIGRDAIRSDWRQACVRSETMLSTMKHLWELHQNDLRWRKQLQDSRRLVADQLHGVSRVMLDLAREIKREGQEMHRQEEQIRSALEQLGVSVHDVEIISLEEGRVEIEIVHGFADGHDICRKVIAPLLSDILGENIAVLREEPLAGGNGNGDGGVFSRGDGLFGGMRPGGSDEFFREEVHAGDRAGAGPLAAVRKLFGRRGFAAGGGLTAVLFVSAKAFEVETGFACAAKGGGLLSGDSFTLRELASGKFVAALSDGMGNGERAKRESMSALSILEQLLQSGMDERLAVKSVNSILLLRSADEMFTTIDLALIDLYTARATFLKSGSTPSFIKRGRDVFAVAAGNLPAGILQDIEIDAVTVPLKPGDILVLMTDGIYDAPGPTVNKELWMRRILSEIEAEDPQDIADCLLESVIRRHGGDIRDDMTVVVVRIERHTPEWAPVRWPGRTPIERPKPISP